MRQHLLSQPPYSNFINRRNFLLQGDSWRPIRNNDAWLSPSSLPGPTPLAMVDIESGDSQVDRCVEALLAGELALPRLSNANEFATIAVWTSTSMN